MTPKEVILMSRGYLMKRSKEWEQTRVIAYTVESTKRRKGGLPTMRQWMPLPTDKHHKPDIMISEMMEQWKAMKQKPE